MVLLSGFVFSISSVDKTKQLNIFIFVNLLFHYLKLVFWKDCVPLNTLTRNVQNTELTKHHQLYAFPHLYFSDLMNEHVSFHELKFI